MDEVKDILFAHLKKPEAAADSACIFPPVPPEETAEDNV
jgi:hypothetical protein